MRLTAAHRQLLRAMADGRTLKAHRYLDGSKEYRLHDTQQQGDLLALHAARHRQHYFTGLLCLPMQLPQVRVDQIAGVAGRAEGGLQHLGETVICAYPLKGEEVRARIAAPLFVDPEGVRLRV